MRYLPVVSAVLATAIGDYYIFGQINGMWWICLMFAAYAGNQLVLLNSSPIGHGVSNRTHLLGMPVWMDVFYLAILVAILYIALSDAPELLPATNANFHAFGLAMFCGWVAGLVDWYTYAFEATYYYSEYQERSKMKAQGFSPEQVERYIEQMRTEGYLAPKK